MATQPSTATVCQMHRRLSEQAPLYAGQFGVVGDGVTDDTQAAQRFLDLCKDTYRIANFGSLKVKVSAPLTLSNAGMVFDRQSFGASGVAPGVGNDEPGIYPTGSGYTALTVTGIVSDFCVTVFGSGFATQNSDGSMSTDTRPDIVGIQFGGPQDAATLILSYIRWARVVNVKGTAIRIVGVFDCNFEKILTETCGGPNGYAISIEDGITYQTTNESVFHYIQAEFSKQKSIYISPNTLSCTFSKIHSERANGVAGIPLWLLGGASCTYMSTRLQCENGLGGVATYALSSTFIGLRPENVTISVNASGGTTNFIGCGGIVQPTDNQSGICVFSGCALSVRNANAGFRFKDCTIDLLEIGFVPNAASVVAEDCSIATFRPAAGQTQARATLRNCQVASGAFGATTVLTNGTVFHTSTVNYTIGYCTAQLLDSTIVAGSAGTGTITIDTALVEGKGAWKIIGNLTFGPNRQSLFDDGGVVIGTVTGSGVPTSSQFLQHKRGLYCAELSPAAGGTPGYRCVADPASPGGVGTWKREAALAT